MNIHQSLGESFEKCVQEVLRHPEFLKEWDRLHGSSFATGPAINKLVDQATGKFEQDATELFEFIRDYIWAPLYVVQEATLP